MPPTLHATNPGLSSRSRITPVALEISSAPSDALGMFAAWVKAFEECIPDDESWMPVGRVGPIVILGHYAPETATPTRFPMWPFGLVKIPETTYRQISADALRRLSSFDDGSLACQLDQDLRQPAASDSKRAVLNMLAKFPGSPTESDVVRTAVSSAQGDEELLNNLPSGWREATLAVTADAPIVDLSAFCTDPNIAKLVPEHFAREHEMVPLFLDGGTLFVASPVTPIGSAANAVHSAWKGVRPSNADGVKLTLVLCTKSSRIEIERRQATRNTKTTTIAPFASTAARATTTTANVLVKIALKKRLHDKIEIGAPSITDELLLQVALYQAIKENASDLHIDLANGEGRFRIRRDGIMRPLGSGRFALKRLQTLINLLRIWIDASGGNIDPADGKFPLRWDDAYYDVRVSILPAPDAAESGHAYAVLRFLPKDGNVRSLTDLHLAREEHEALLEVIDKPHGIVLVTGPTGSGKTTTLNAIIQQLNRGTSSGEEGTLKIMTIEDPVEYVIDGVQQVNASAKLSFAEAIRRFLRHDPDIILVGEIRDEETARAAIGASRSGHLVFSTLHTNGAAETISRLCNLNIPAYDLDGPLVALIAQRLVRRLCKSCKVATSPSSKLVTKLTDAGIQIPDTVYEPGSGTCPHCDRGWHGRIPIFEIVKVTDNVRKAIASRLSENELKAVCKAEGFRPLTEQAYLKVTAGITSFSEAHGLDSGWD